MKKTGAVAALRVRVLVEEGGSVNKHTQENVRK